MKNETKHTPGPWRIKSSNRTGSLEIVGGEKHHHVCKLDGNLPESHFHAQEANAALIAAAPDMLAALEALCASLTDDILASLDHEDEKRNAGHEENCTLCAALSVIAKIRGN
jgi:hypothetical protein